MCLTYALGLLDQLDPFYKPNFINIMVGTACFKHRHRCCYRTRHHLLRQLRNIQYLHEGPTMCLPVLVIPWALAQQTYGGRSISGVLAGCD